MWINTTMWSWTRWWKKEANWSGPSPDGEEKSGVREDLDTQEYQLYINLLDKIIALISSSLASNHVNKPILEYESSYLMFDFTVSNAHVLSINNHWGYGGWKSASSFYEMLSYSSFLPCWLGRWCDILHVSYQSTLKALLNCTWTSHTILHRNPSYLKR